MIFNIGERVKHKDIKGKIGTIIKKVPDSDYYYVKLACTIWSMRVDNLVRVK